MTRSPRQASRSALELTIIFDGSAHPAKAQPTCARSAAVQSRPTQALVESAGWRSCTGAAVDGVGCTGGHRRTGVAIYIGSEDTVVGGGFTGLWRLAGTSGGSGSESLEYSAKKAVGERTVYRLRTEPAGRARRLGLGPVHYVHPLPRSTDPSAWASVRRASGDRRATAFHLGFMELYTVDSEAKIYNHAKEVGP